MTTYKRSFFVSFIVIVLVATAFIGLVSAPAAHEETMTSRYDAARTADYGPVAGSTTPINQTKWKYTIDWPVSEPVVANGVVYVTSSYIDNNLYAINSTTGVKLWSTTSGSYGGSPSVASGLVFVHGKEDEILYALNAATGAWVWNTTDKFVGSPAFVNGILYIGARDFEGIYITAYNAATGEKIWRSPNAYNEEEKVTVHNDTIFQGSGFGYMGLYALYASNGTEKWNLTATAPAGLPVAANDLLYQGSRDYRVYAYDASSGTPRWNYTTHGEVNDYLAVAKGRVYAKSGDNNLYALNATTGAKLWSRAVPGRSPVIGNNVVYLTSGSTIYALDAETGADMQTYNFGASVSVPVIYNNTLYVGSDDGNVYALGAKTALIPTALTTSAPLTAYVSQNFAVTGTATANGTAFANRTVYLQRSLNNASFTNVTSMKTNETGGYAFNRTESSISTYYYRTFYPGSSTYAKSTSNVVSVTITAGIIRTAITISAPDSTQRAFSITGTATTNGTAFTNRTVSLYRYNAGTDAWTKVASMKTDTGGNYTFSRTESAAGTYGYMVMYAGSATYRPSTSTSVWVDVA